MRPRTLRVKVAPGTRAGLPGMRRYVWRDPARCSPERLAELAAHDDYIRALEKLWSTPYHPKRDRRPARGLL
jgi:hypothetical protein